MHSNPNAGENIFAGRLQSGVSLSPGGPVQTDYVTPMVLACLGILAACFTVRAFSTLAYPFPLDCGEGAVLSASWHAASGEKVYRVAKEAPFVFNVYNPLQIYLGAAALRIFGAGPLGPRLVSLAFCIGAIGIVFLFVRRETGSRAAALVAVFFLIAERHFYSRVGYAVADFAAIFFSLLGLYVWRSRQRGSVLALVFFALAFFSKQTSLAAAAAAFTALFIEGRRRESITLFGFFAVFIAAGLALLGVLFGKAYFVNAFVYVRTAPYALNNLLRHIMIAGGLYFVALGACGIMARRALGSRRLVLPVLYLLFALGPVLATVKGGSNNGYFFDFAAAVSILVGFVWVDIRIRALSGKLSIAVIALVVLQLFAVGFGATHRLSPFGDGTVRKFRHDSAVRDALMEHDGVVFCREVGFDMGTRARAVASDSAELSFLIQLGKLPDDVLVKPLCARAFPLVIITKNEPPWTLVVGRVPEAIRQHYRLDRKFYNLQFYVPKGTGAP